VRVGAGAHAGAVVAITGRVEFGLAASAHPSRRRAQHERARVHARGQLPAQLAEALADLVVEIDRVRDQEPEAEADRGQAPGEDAAAPARWGGVSVAVVVFVVFDPRGFGHWFVGFPPRAAKGRGTAMR
jgi:hypothetical protein